MPSLTDLAKRYRRLRDFFLPPALRTSTTITATTTRQRRRARRLLSLLLVTAAAAFASVLGQLAQGLWQSALGAMVGVLLALGTAALIRRGLSIERASAVFLSGAIALGSGLALAAGREGLTSLFWIALAPTLALSTTSRRGVAVVLALTSAAITATVLFVYHRTAPPLIDVSRAGGAHVVALLGAMFAYFALTVAYERETAAGIAELERNNAALAEARYAAEAANRAKSEFLAAISHEIRTPMNGVLGMTAVMLSNPLPDDVRDGLSTIRQSGDSLMALLNDVLDLSRIESGRLELERVPVDLGAEVRAVATLLEAYARERGNSLEVRVAPDAPGHVLGDPLRLRQIALNLVSNALKFTHGGEVHVALAAAPEGVALEVTDTGVGIAPEKLAGLFRPFQQADVSTTRRFGGTGLGLAIVRQLVDAMRGRIAVDSTLGQGSRFTVTLPLVPCTAPVRPAAGAADAPVRRLKVLLAEDNAINQKVATMMLQGMGHEVVVAVDGERTLEAAASQRFDVILMDLHMPMMDGFEAALTLRDRGDRTPIVALTAASLPEEQQRCLAVGMVDVLLKPIRKAELQRVLDRRASPGATPLTTAPDPVLP